MILATLAFSVLTARTTSASAIDFAGMGRYAAIRVSLNGYNIYDGPGGELTWPWWDSTVMTPGGLQTGYSSTFYAYCTGLLHVLSDPETVTIRSTNLLRSTTGAGGQSWLVNPYAVDVHHNDGTGIDAAALQVAIWGTVYDTTPNLTSGSPSVGAFALLNSGSNSAATNAAITNQAMTYLTGWYSGPGGSYIALAASWLDASLNNGQDQIIAMPVPEPGSILLFGTGLLGVARGIRRARTRLR